jgi:hypothetical protein
MQRSQWLAILMGAISVILGVGYLILVQILDWRGEMLPAEMSAISNQLFGAVFLL